MTTKKKVAVPEEFYISVRLGDKSFEGSGATLEDAIMSLPKKLKVVSKGFVSVTHGTCTTEKMYQPSGIKRLLFPMARHIVAKELSFLLK